LNTDTRSRVSGRYLGLRALVVIIERRDEM